MKLTKRVCARCVYARGVFALTPIHQAQRTRNPKGAQLQILTKGDSIRYHVHASDGSETIRMNENGGIWETE